MNSRDPSYAPPEIFKQFVAGVLRTVPDGSPLAEQWRARPAELMERDPRYVAFRTAHDWAVLHARILAEDEVAGKALLDLTGRVDPFTVALPSRDLDEPAGLIAGDPIMLADGGFRNREIDPNFVEPARERVNDGVEAILYFHFAATFLRRQWRSNDPRFEPLGFLRPEAFASYVAAKLARHLSAEAVDAWKNRPAEEVERDPRYIAHKCAFDRGMIGIMASYEYWSKQPQPQGEPITQPGEVDAEAGVIYDCVRIEDLPADFELGVPFEDEAI